MTYFEDLRVGARTQLGSHTFTADEIKEFAREFDPQPFHLDEEAAARSHFGALCASGWHTAALCLRHVVVARQGEQAERRRRGEPVARTGPSPGLRDLKWPRPVYVGDTITFAQEIVELRAVANRPAVGLRVARNTGTNQRGELVYSVLSSTFIERRRPHSVAMDGSGATPSGPSLADHDDPL
jgi:acyl dehydratase